MVVLWVDCWLQQVACTVLSSLHTADCKVTADLVIEQPVMIC